MAAVHPGGAQACGARRFNVEKWIIADVEDVSRLQAQVARKMLEAAGMWFRGADLPRVQRDAEELREPDQLQICIAVAERRNRIARTQSLERGLNISVGLQLVARREEYLEGALRHVFSVPAFARVRRQCGEAQVGEVVGIVRLEAGEPLACG